LITWDFTLNSHFKALLPRPGCTPIHGAQPGQGEMFIFSLFPANISPYTKQIITHPLFNGILMTGIGIAKSNH